VVPAAETTASTTVAATATPVLPTTAATTVL